MSTFTTFDIGGVEVENGEPEADRIIAGSPKFRTWNLDEAEGGIYCGIWEATPGKWHVSYEEWEYFHILEGHSILTEEGGEPIHLKAGGRLIVKPGFKGTWEVVETTRKDYVIRL